MKKFTTLLFLVLLSAGTAWADVMINLKNFPDANFRTYLANQSYGSDGLLSDEEIAGIKSLMLSNKSIQSLNGIKNFTALQYLLCDGNLLTSLDVSGCETLKELDCSSNQLTSLNVSGCSALKSIMCTNNQLKDDGMDKLIESMPTTQDGELYIIYNENDQNKMTSTHVAAAKAKGWIPYCYDKDTWKEYVAPILINNENFPDNNFRNWLLIQSYGYDGVLTDAEIAGVTSIDVSGKSIQSLKGIEFFTALTSLNCSENKLTTLDLSNNTALTSLACKENKLYSLNLSNNTALTSLNCYENQLNFLDLSKNIELTEIYCGSNRFTSLDVSGCTELTSLYCYYNQLTSLDVSKNMKLISLSCNNNRLTSLDVSKNMKLIMLSCRNNQLTSLDVSNNTKLTTLYCEDNKLASLDVSGCTSLAYLSCNSNQLTSLDMSKNYRLLNLYCYQNKIKDDAMDALVASLPTASSGAMRVIFNVDEQNVMTTAQVTAARAKGWIPYYTEGELDSWHEYIWKVYPGYETETITININNENFPDNNFRNWLLSQIYGSDGKLSAPEIAGVTSIGVTFSNIQSLKGIEFFTELTTLSCSGNQLESLDLSKNTKLTYLSCYSNKIEGAAMDALIESLPTVSNCKMYVIYNYKTNDGNVMTTTQVAAAKAKGWNPYYYHNSSGIWTWGVYPGSEPEPITINETNFPDYYFRNWLLSQSYGSDGKLTASEIAGVTSINVNSKSSIRSLKGIEFFTALERLYCAKNSLTSLDVSKNTKLTYLQCNSNQFTYLDVSNNAALYNLNCSHNQLTSLDVSKNTALTLLDCSYNQISSLDVSNNAALYNLNCSGNQLTSLDVSKNTALEVLACYEGQLTSLDVSKNTALRALSLDGNKFTSIDVSKNTKLTMLSCSDNQLTSLDISENTELISLICSGNKFTSLEVSKNTALEFLYCYNNQIKEAAMDALIESLPTVNSNEMRVIDYNVNEQNVMTTIQVAAARAKGWIPYYREKGEDWKVFPGIDPTGVNNVEASDADDSAPWYTINGTRLTGKPTAPGIYIHKDKKVLVEF